MRRLIAFNFSSITVAIGLLIALAPAYAFADTKVKCLQPPQEIINSVLGSDPVVSLQLAGKALRKCGDTRYLDLQVDRETLDIPLGVTKLEQLTGVWVSDMWLHVDEGITPPIAELLSIEDSRIEQGFVRWYDPDEPKNATYLSAYMPGIGTARLQPDQDGMKIVAFAPSSHKSVHNPYLALSGSEPDRHLHQVMAIVPIHLGEIVRMTAFGNRLLLVDSRGIVRTYRRHSIDNVFASHKFFLAAEVNARSWPCVLRVLSGRLADKGTQDLPLILVARSLSIHSLNKAIIEIDNNIEKLKAQSKQALDLTKERGELVKQLIGLNDSDFREFASQFDDPGKQPSFCLQN